MTDAVLLTDFDGPVARLTLNRPDAMNTLDGELAAALADAAERAAAEPRVRAVLLAGNGRLLSAGGDLRYLAAAGPEGAKSLIANLHRTLLAFARMGAPLVVAASGAAGAGLSLVAAADYAVAASGAKFTAAYTAAGLSPDGGLSFNLPRLIGVRRARTMILLNRPLPAAEALAIGLIDEIAEPDALLAAAEAVASKLAQGPAAAFGRVKHLIGGEIDRLAEHLDRERAGILAQLDHEEGKEGMAAFFERRPADFVNAADRG